MAAHAGSEARFGKFLRTRLKIHDRIYLLTKIRIMKEECPHTILPVCSAAHLAVPFGRFRFLSRFFFFSVLGVLVGFFDLSSFFVKRNIYLAFNVYGGSDSFVAHAYFRSARFFSYPSHSAKQIHNFMPPLHLNPKMNFTGREAPVLASDTKRRGSGLHKLSHNAI